MRSISFRAIVSYLICTIQLDVIMTSGFATIPINRRQFVKQSALVLQGGYTSDVSVNGNYWNRETSREGDFSGKVVHEARIISLSDPDDLNNASLTQDLPESARLLAVGSSIVDFDLKALKKEEPNVIFVSHPASREPLVQLLQALPSIEWVHTRSAGIDFIASDGLAAADVLVTNAKGMYSSTLAEYTMMAISYFAKDLPRLMRQKGEKNWNKYPIEEIRGKTLGIVGYGDIGRATAKLAKAYGM